MDQEHVGRAWSSSLIQNSIWFILFNPLISWEDSSIFSFSLSPTPNLVTFHRCLDFFFFLRNIQINIKVLNERPVCFCRYTPSSQLRSQEDAKEWLRSHSAGGLQDTAANSPFSSGSSVTSPSGTRFNFSQLGEQLSV